MIKGAFLTFLLAFALPSQASASVESAIEAARSLVALRAMDARVLTIGHRLAVANADLCPDRAIAPGIVVHGLSQYGPDHRQAAKAAFGLGEQPAILALARGGAAAAAGLREDDQLIRVGDGIFAPDAPGEASSYAVVGGWTVQLEKGLQAGTVPVDILRNGQKLTVSISPEQGCPSRFQVVVASRFGGKADGNYVQLTSNLVHRVQDDGELAAVLAHELAHNILRHRDRLNEAGVSRGVLKYFGKNASSIKQTEIEADRLSVYLLERAGYPPAAAEAFWRRFGPQHPWGPFGTPTHPGWRSRAQSLAEEAAELKRRKDAGETRPLPDFMQMRQGAPD